MPSKKTSSCPSAFRITINGAVSQAGSVLRVILKIITFASKLDCGAPVMMYIAASHVASLTRVHWSGALSGYHHLMPRSALLLSSGCECQAGRQHTDGANVVGSVTISLNCAARTRITRVVSWRGTCWSLRQHVIQSDFSLARASHQVLPGAKQHALGLRDSHGKPGGALLDDRRRIPPLAQR